MTHPMYFVENGNVLKMKLCGCIITTNLYTYSPKKGYGKDCLLLTRLDLVN